MLIQNPRLIPRVGALMQGIRINTPIYIGVCDPNPLILPRFTNLVFEP